MNTTRLVFPKGDQAAISSPFGVLSFDDLHRLRWFVRKEISQHWAVPPKRILGCLEDNVQALFALLFLTEITDYMPINPALPDTETTALLHASGADMAVVSRTLQGEKGSALTSVPILVWDDVIDAALADLRSDASHDAQIEWATQGRLILHTSGSTGLPKRVPITLEAMNASARNIAAGHDLRRDDHALNALPTFHIGALVDVMLAPFAAGGSISITNKRSPNGLLQALATERPTWLQVVPTLLRRLIEEIEPDDLAKAGQSLRFIRSISAPVPPDLKEQAEQAFGCPIIEMYGMTETAGQIATMTRNPKDFRTGSVGRPVGVKVAILDRFGNTLEATQTGEVCVAGATVFDGYEGSEKEDVFFRDWFRTGDLGELDHDGFLFLRGRIKEMVNVGGEKVSPHEVESAAMQMPDIIEAAAYAVPHPTLGEQVGLTIATRGPVAPDVVKTFLEGRLAGFKCPNTISIVEQLPRLANAKVDRLLLKRTAQADWQKRQSVDILDAVEYDTPEARAVALHWARILKCRPPAGDDDFFDMGGDSLSATQLLLTLEKALNRSISPNQLFEAPTFTGLTQALLRENSTSTTPSLRSIRYIQEKTAGWPGKVVVPNGLLRSLGGFKTGHPLFWSSQAHEEIEAILETLGKNRPVYVTGSLRRLRKRTPIDFETVGEQLADEIQTVQPSGPIVLGGFCGGAWVMHHAAECLLRRGRDIRVFISFDYWPNRVLDYPMVHCMSNCEINSARVHYAQHHLAEGLLHPHGLKTLIIESKHSFEAEHIAQHLVPLDSFIEGKQNVPNPPPLGEGHWSFAQRLKAPQARIKMIGQPRVFAAGGTAKFTVEVTNRSEIDWQPTKTSGLSIQVDLINLDGHMRKANLAFGAFRDVVPSGGKATFDFQITFPEKRVPMWLSCNLVSQGLTHFRSRGSGGQKKLLFPGFAKPKEPIASA